MQSSRRTGERTVYVSVLSLLALLNPQCQAWLKGKCALIMEHILPDMDEFKLAHTIPSSHPAGVESMVQNMTEEHP